MLKAFALISFCCTFLVTQTKAPERKANGNVITSERDPKIRIELPENVSYVGTDRWVLYDVADCELHAFVEADAKKNVKKRYWVQFEAYVPSKPELAHTYDSPRHATIDGMDFFVDSWVRARNAETRKGSDREHIEALLSSKGYKTPAAMMDVRLVHLMDPQKRKELMIIYGEDLASTGFTVEDLSEGGKAFARWPEIEKGLVERAVKNIHLEASPRT